MDNNPQNTQVSQQPVTSVPPVVANPVPTTPPQPTPIPTQENKPSRKNLWIFLIIVLIILIPALFLGYMYLNSQKFFNAGLYQEPASQIQFTPTPTEAEINPTATSDAALDEDAKKLNQSINNVNTDLNGVDQGLNDKQTNLQ